MALKHKLESLFNNDYPGSDILMKEVIEKVFGKDIEYKNDDLAQRPEYAEKAKKAGLKRINYVAEIKDQNYKSFDIVFLDVIVDDSKNIERSRVNIQQLIRSIVQEYHHLFIVFHYENTLGSPWRFSYAFKAASNADTTSAKRFTYVFGKGYRGKTAAERFETLAKSAHKDSDFIEAFSVQALSDDFFDDYRAYYATFVEFLTGEPYSDEPKIKEITRKWDWKERDRCNQLVSTFENNPKLARDYIKKMFGRITFLYFIQRKGWLVDNGNNPDSRYMYNLYKQSKFKDTFLDDVLELLFFYVLNTRKEQRKDISERDNKDITILPGWQHIPYLNGGLFKADDIDPKKCVFPSEYFQHLFKFLDSYNFTIDENDPEDAEIGIDPEMLGRIFENLLEDNKDKGAFYTPKEIVEYMCRESIILYLQNDKKIGLAENQIRSFVQSFDSSMFSRNTRYNIKESLKAVTICDPAIGSGAFPMGMVNLLSKLYVALGVNDEQMSVIKRHIVEKNIYGVDIEKGAVDIARLRFWLAMVVDEKKEEGKEPMPLPNLHFKIMQGNSLLESYKNFDLSKICLSIAGYGTGGFDFDGHRELLRNDIALYYNTYLHDKRDTIIARIKNRVISQIFEETQDEHLLKDIKDVTANNKFFLWHTWFAEVFEKGGFDIIIGNPPYLKEGRANRAIFEEVKKSPYYKGKMDLWYMFACNGIDMLKPNGNLCFIATNNWVTNSGAEKLRQKVNKDTQIIQLCDFRNFMIFKTASIQTMIMQFKKNHDNREYTFDMRNLIGSTLEDVIKLLKKEKCPTTQYLKPKYNRIEMQDRYLTFSNQDDLLDKLANINPCMYFNDLEITQGIVPNPDVVNARNIKKFTKEEIVNNKINVGDPVFIVPTGFFKNLSSSEKDLLKPIYEPVDFSRYFIGNPSSNIIYLTKQDSPSESEMPNIISHLTKYRPIMEERRENQMGRIKFYHLHWPREKSIFEEGEKLLVTRKCVNPVFCYTDKEAYVMMAINVIKTKRANMKYLSGLLNSKLIAYWLKNRGKMQGLNYQLDKEPLQQIPIAVPEAVIQNHIGDIVDEIIKRKAKNINAVTEDLENQIDHIVYHLYDLTYDEVKIIDPDTPISKDEYENFNHGESN